MEQEQVINTTIQETSVNDSTTVKEESSIQEVETYSREDYNKAIQSASSKAKYDILKELGISSVKEFHELKNTYDKAILEKTSLEENITALNNDKVRLEESLLLSKLGVSEEYTNDLLTLAKSKVDENHTLEQVSKDLLEKYPQWRGSKESIRMGTEKKEDIIESTVDKSLLKKYPWLAD